ncbi:MAG: hypothetical protein HYR60_33215 [Acidobacteria bacterium]|nr:hypothetical protein [Acidobacteriota bacterium]
MQPGDTFFIPTPDNPIRHLWIVLTEVDAEGKACCVNITGMGDHIADTTVVLEVGDHPFIEKQSVALFSKAARLDVARIEAEIDNPATRTNWKRFACCTPELLERVRRGLLKSKYTKRAIKDVCRPLWNL